MVEKELQARKYQTPTKRSFQLVSPGLCVAEAVYNCALPKELCLNGADCPYYFRLFLLLEH